MIQRVSSDRVFIIEAAAGDITSAIDVWREAGDGQCAVGTNDYDRANKYAVNDHIFAANSHIFEAIWAVEGKAVAICR